MIGITELSIPKGIKQIHYGCFEGCPNLKKVNFSVDLTMDEIEENVFKSTSIESITIPSSIKIVGKSSFQNCKNLTNVQFLGNNTTIFPSSFYQCNQIESFSFNSAIQNYDHMFSKFVYFSNNDDINIIKDFLVKNEQIIQFHHACLSFSHLLIDDKSTINLSMKMNQNLQKNLSKVYNRDLIFVKHLNNGYYSHDLKEIYFSDFEAESIVIPKDTILISPNAFHYSLLTKIDFEKCSNLEIIGKSSFQDLLIEEITIPNSVSLIDEYAFKCCKKLKKVNIGIDSKLTEIKKGAFDNTAIETILFPSTLTIIEDFAFYECLKLKTVDNHSNRIVFGYKSFYYSAIKDIKFLSDSTFSISSFQGCTNLKELTFLDKPTKLIFDVQSFASSGIESINLDCKVDIYENAFSFCPDLKKVVLKGNDIKCLYNSFESPNIIKFILTLKVELNEKILYPKIHFLFIKDRVILSNVEKFSLNLTFHNKTDPNEYKQSFYYNHKCFVVDNELYYANLINNIDLFQCENKYNDDDKNNQENNIEEIKNNEILTIPKNVKKLYFPIMTRNGLTNLNFQKMSHLKKIVFYPNSLVDDIGPPGFFSYCNLVEITIPKLVKKIPSHSFENCHFLENVYFEKESLLNEVGEFAFSNTKINKIILPDSVNIIKQSAFAFNNNLKTVIFKGEIIEQEAFLQTGIIKFQLSNNTRIIGSNAFQYCHHLSQFDIDINDSNLSEINEYAFSDTSINEINISSNIKIIKKFSFNGCKYLKKINISNDSNLEIIEEFSFAGDISLEIINIPKSIINIHPTAFINTPSLISIMTESNNKYFVMNEDEVYLKNDINLELIFVPRYLKQIKIIQNCSKINSGSFCGPNIEDIIFPDLSLKTIGYCSFAHSTGLKRITLPQSIINIEDEAFIDCQNLETIEFDRSCQLKEIPKYCFAFSGLISIKLPESLEIINDSSFYFCSKLRNINISNTRIKYIGDSSFYGTDIEEIIFPSTTKYISNHSFEHTKSLKLIELSRCSRIKNYPPITQNLKSFRSFLSKMKRIKTKPQYKKKLEEDQKANSPISNLILQPNTNSPIIIRPNQPNQMQKISQSKTNLMIHSPRRIMQSPRNVYLRNQSRKTNQEKETTKTCYIHESSFQNSFVKIIICNLNKYKWFSFIDKCSKIEEYIVNSDIHLYLKKLVCERRKTNKNDQLLGNLYKVSKLEWKNNAMLKYNKKIPKSLNPFHFLSSAKLIKINLGDDLKIKTIPKCVFSFTHYDGIIISFKEIIPSTVLEIKASAFKYCNELEIVKFLPNSKLNKIGSFAFYGCSNLKELSIPNNIKSIPFKCFAFSGLLVFIFPNSIQKVDKMAFFNCMNLTKIKFNEGLIELDSSFANNNSLQSIDLPNSLEKINTRVFANCINLKNVNTTEKSKLVEIYNFSFENTKIERLKLNPKIKKLFEPKDVPQLNKISFYKGELINFKQFKDGSIYEYSADSYRPSQKGESENDIFVEKNKLYDYIMSQPKNYKLIFVPKNLRKLKIHVLNGMKNLKTIEYANGTSINVNNFPNIYNINDNIKHIKISCKYSYFDCCKFSYFKSLEVIELGESTNVFFIPKYAFENCTNLKRVSIPSCCTLIEERSFKNCINLELFEFKNVENIYEFKILPKIESEAFYNCSSLTEIIIPSVISKIGKKAFMNCTSLKRFEIDNNGALCNIGESSFQNCSSLEKISFSTYAYYITIGNSAFMNCSNLKEVSIKGRSLYNIDFRAFYNCTFLLSFEFTYYQISNDLSYFDYIFIGFESFMNCSSLKQFIVDMSSADINKLENPLKLKLCRKIIQRKAFFNCKSLCQVQLLIGNLQEIQEDAFSDCSSLKRLEIKSNENLFLPKHLNKSTFNNVKDDLIIKVIQNKKEISSIKVSSLVKQHKIGKRTFKKYTFHLKNLFCDDDDLENNSKIKFSDKRMCFLFNSKKINILCDRYYLIPSIFSMTIPIKFKSRSKKSIFDDNKDYTTEYNYMPILKPPFNIYK